MSRRSVRRWGDIDSDQVVEADVVIMGAGAGGAAAAARFAESGKRVVLLESGSYFGFGEFPNSAATMLDKLYFEDGQLASAGPTFVPMAAGTGVGGSTLINSAICFRGPDNVLTRWSERLGNPRYLPAAMAPYYAEVEETIGVATTPPDIAGPNNLVAVRGIEALGLDGGFFERNAPGCIGCGVCYAGCPVGGKGSVDLNFLGRRAFENNAICFANTVAREVLMDSGRAVGLRGTMRDPETKRWGPEITVRAEKVVLSGGAIGTAKFLLATGVSGNDHIGEHLHIHPTAGLFAFFDEDIRIWQGVTQGAYAHHPEHNDILIETFSLATEMLYTQAATSGRAGKDFLAEITKLAGIGVLIRDDTEGSLSLGDRHQTMISYDMLETDARKLVTGLRLCAEVMFAAGAKRINTGIYYTGWTDSMDALSAVLPDFVEPNDMMLYASHLQGTCRMGASYEDGVCDSAGKVWDVDNLYIADSSMFPEALGTNPQMTVMALALNVAEQILEAW